MPIHVLTLEPLVKCHVPHFPVLFSSLLISCLLIGIITLFLSYLFVCLLDLRNVKNLQHHLPCV